MEEIKKSPCLLEGIISVRAAIEGKKRKIQRVLVDVKKIKQRDRKIKAFLHFLNDEGIEFEGTDREEIDKIVANYSGKNAGSTHAGVVAIAGEREYLSLEKMIEQATKGDYFVFLDGIEDPFNLGYCIRTLFAMGVTGIILPYRSWSNAQGVIARASAGASELCNIAMAYTEDEQTVRLIKEAKIDIVCSALSHDSVEIYDFAPEKPFVLFIGGEKRGISKEFMENADKIVHIPYARTDVKYSLTAASVCSAYAIHLAKYASVKE